MVRVVSPDLSAGEKIPPPAGDSALRGPQLQRHNSLILQIKKSTPEDIDVTV
jgi:hypothetical protein